MCATCVMQPIDMIKVRVQLAGEAGSNTSPFKIAGEILKKDGFGSLYKGLDAALVRQATYTTTRMGVFLNLMEWAKEKKEGKPLTLLDRCVISITAGGVGAVVGNPADLCLIRMQADKTLPVEQRRNYTNVGNAISRVISEEGFFALWKGANPTVVRAMVLNLGMLAPYDYCKGIFQKSLGWKD